MKLSLSEIVKFGDCIPSSRNFVEGERVLKSNHVLSCEKVATNAPNNIVNILAYCLQTSDVKSKPHEIKGEISINGEIIKFQCSCKAGLIKKCKHILAVLLYCYRYDTDDFPDFSLEQYKPTRVKDHDCFKNAYRGCDAISVSQDQINQIKELSLKLNGTALMKHTIGRHEIVEVSNECSETNRDLDKTLSIINNEESEIMKIISQVKVHELQDCCHARLTDFYSEDLMVACIQSEHCFANWLKVRQFRISGSRVYKLYTYSANKNPNWEKKSLAYFYPKSFHSQYTEYGKQYEKKAVEEYEKFTGTEVITCGCIISKLNPWMSYSPDGIVMRDGKPFLLIEVKCPFIGKKNTIADVLPKIKYLQVDQNNNIMFKERHEYYCQIQMGMAVLNVESTDFIIYASCDSSFIIVNVPLNANYIINVWSVVKNTFCNHMIHYVCINEMEISENNNNIANNK